jgi:ribosomal peptide maturation radical SAM protein 1
MRVALIVMPFAAADRPSLAAGLLQAALRRCRIECETKYFNVTMQRLLGAASYSYLAHWVPAVVMAGQWTFSRALFGGQHSSWESYQKEVLDNPHWGLRKSLHGLVRDLLDQVPLFLRIAYESNDWSRFDLVGFTCTFEQTVPSLALARMIRRHHPQVWLAAGGANFEQSMARPYVEQLGLLDFVATGEADRSFPQLCCNLRDLKLGRATTLRVPPGFVYRWNGVVYESPPAAEPVQLDELPTPSYEDFFRVAARTSGFHPGGHWLPVEASRGCWWGQKNQCTFCGLNGERLAFRQKSWRRVVAEADELRARHGAVRLQYTDNALGLSYLKDLVPFWARRRDQTEKYFEVRANLDREQLQMLRKAGVTQVQIGVESLDDETLRLMRKGVTAAQNVAVIRWCTEVGLQPLWNLILGFPGEPPDSYRQTSELISKITHLPPLSVIGPIRMDRFSPNFNHWQELGFTSRSPARAYRHVFPMADEILEEIAYYFDFDHPQLDAALTACQELGRQIRTWQEKARHRQNGELAVKPHLEGGCVLVDSRYNRPAPAMRLGPSELAVLLACDAPRSRAGALHAAAAQALNEDVEAALDRFLERGVIAQVGHKLITLALLPSRHQLQNRNEIIDRGGEYHGTGQVSGYRRQGYRSHDQDRAGGT